MAPAVPDRHGSTEPSPAAAASRLRAKQSACFVYGTGEALELTEGSLQGVGVIDFARERTRVVARVLPPDTQRAAERNRKKRLWGGFSRMIVAIGGAVVKLQYESDRVLSGRAPSTSGM